MELWSYHSRVRERTLTMRWKYLKIALIGAALGVLVQMVGDFFTPSYGFAETAGPKAEKKSLFHKMLKIEIRFLSYQSPGVLGGRSSPSSPLMLPNQTRGINPIPRIRGGGSGKSAPYVCSTLNV
jgi:hypothetical protein